MLLRLIEVEVEVMLRSNFSIVTSIFDDCSDHPEDDRCYRRRRTRSR